MNTMLRQSLEHWFSSAGVEPSVVAEVEDLAMLQTLGQHGLGLFAAPTLVANRICEQYRILQLGELPGVHERFYAISTERRLNHPAVVAIFSGARERLLAPSKAAPNTQ